VSPRQSERVADLERAYGPAAAVSYSRRHVVVVWTHEITGHPLEQLRTRLIGHDGNTIPLERR